MTELGHAEDAGPARGVAAAIAQDTGMIDDHHRQPLLAQEVLGDLHQHGGLHRGRLPVQKHTARRLAGRAARRQHLEHVGLPHAGQGVCLEERHRQEGNVLQALDLESVGAAEHAVQDVPVGLAVLRVMPREGPHHREQALPLLVLPEAVGRQVEQLARGARHRTASAAL
jgi:hypothetical protein